MTTKPGRLLRFLTHTSFLFFLLAGCVRWNAARAQFSTTGFDTVIIEKRNPEDFTYSFGEPYDLQARLIYQGVGAVVGDPGRSYQHCRWQLSMGENAGTLMVEFRIRVEHGVDLSQGTSYLMPNYENVLDPPPPGQANLANRAIPTFSEPANDRPSQYFTAAGIAPPAYSEPAYNRHWFPRLEVKSPVKINGKGDDSINATLLTGPAVAEAFRKKISVAKKARETELPILGHERYDPTLRDAGLEVTAAKRNYLLLCSGAQRRAWIFRDDQLLAMFQYDLDHIPSVSAPTYGFRIEPYMFIRPGLPKVDQRQIPFLLMMARAAAEMVKDKRYFF